MELSLSRLRGSGNESGFVLVHGSGARDCSWFWKLAARASSADAGGVLVASARLSPPLVQRACSMHHVCIALLQISGASPFWRPLDIGNCGIEDNTCKHSSPLDALLEQGQFARNLRQREVPGAAAALLAIEDVASLLLSHRISDIVTCLSSLTASGPVAAALDVAVVGAPAFAALAAQANVIVQLNSDGSARGVATVTERMQTGKTRSYYQSYTVAPSGGVTLGATSVAPAAAALILGGVQVAGATLAAAAAASAVSGQAAAVSTPPAPPPAIIDVSATYAAAEDDDLPF